MTMASDTNGYNRLLLLVAGLGGLLYGIDIGIIAGALPYLEATSRLNAGQLSFVVAAVLLGSVISTLFAGLLADGMGRKPLMTTSGVLFVCSIPIIALSHGYLPLVLGRLLQGISGGLIGVVVPLYLAECLGAASRGRGTAMFQWLLTLGIVAAALVGMYFSLRVQAVAELGDAARLFAFKDQAWRSIFWVSLPPGVLFVIGSLMVAESPRWLFRRGRQAAARGALLRSRSAAAADAEMHLMEEAAQAATRATTHAGGDSLLRRRYVVPFLLACVILACTQATGVNSIIGYSTTILLQSGLSDLQAHWGYVLLTAVNFLMTVGAVMLVDRKGRKFLLCLGTGGMVVALTWTALLFRHTETQRVDAGPQVAALMTPQQTLRLRFDQPVADRLAAAAGARGAALAHRPTSLILIYSCGDFRAASAVARSNDPAALPIEISPATCLPSNPVVAFFSNPFASLARSRLAPLRIEHALLSPVPDRRLGWMVAASLLLFMAFFAVGPGVVVWLALSELMPTRIRSNGMSVALLLNQAVSTTFAAIFLPTVGAYGYSRMFAIFAGFTVLYFFTALLFLPETKGKTLEQIEAGFAAPGRRGKEGRGRGSSRTL